jgi:diacylglycerol kinase
MDEEALKVELAAAAGLGIAALNLQQAFFAKLALEGKLAPSEILDIIDTASETIVASTTYSIEEKTIAASALNGVASVWRKPARRN